MKRGVPAAAPLVSAISIAAVLFVSLGRVDVPWAWAYVALWFGFATATVIFVDPVLLRERVRPGPGARESLAVASMAAASVWYGHLVVAGLDVGRFHWSDRVPSAARLAGFATLASAFAAIGWALVVNPFFSSVIRVQTERNHRVVSSGPYALVRHPGYAAAITGSFASALALGSWLSMVPAAVASLLLVRRTEVEDRTLQNELPGYAEYAQRVRYRLVPGVW